MIIIFVYRIKLFNTEKLFMIFFKYVIFCDSFYQIEVRLSSLHYESFGGGTIECD